MTPEEKANELINKFNQIVSVTQAKQCVLITIDEILQQNPTIKGTSSDLCTQIVQTKAYWFRVQEALNNINLN